MTLYTPGSRFPGLEKYVQWINWKLIDLGDGKTAKRPLASVTNPAHWTTYAAAASRAQAQGLGVGFVFTAGDPFFFLDLDGALQDDGTWAPYALDICARFSGCLMELSTSGRGLHIIGTGTPPEHGCRNDTYHMELYHQDRFVALTGSGIQGDADTDAQQAVAAMAAEYFPPSMQQPSGERAEWTDTPDPGWKGPEDDQALLELMRRARVSAGAAFGESAALEALWTGDPVALARAYPGSDGEPDMSRADMALAQHLAFWTGKNCERIERMMRLSALVRDKWEREDYVQNTILKAVARQVEVYTGRKSDDPGDLPGLPAPRHIEAPAAAPGAPPPAADPAVAPEVAPGGAYMSLNAQKEMFAGVVWVEEDNRMYMPDGTMLDQARFDIRFGGHIFLKDAYGEKIAKGAWDAATNNTAWRVPHVSGLCFRPDLEPRALVPFEGLMQINSYRPLETPRIEGDAKPFLEHLEKLIPDESDREILLAYMAALVQHPGVKFQWAPVMQGVQGNGKTLFIRALSYAIGEKYTHIPNASDLGNKFNAWIVGKLFVGIEEIHIGDRQEILDALKPLITNDRVEIQGKGTNQRTGDNRANFFMCSNHKMAVRKTEDDRRYSVFYTAQQTTADITRDGMGGGYFPALYAWARKDGYAIINDYLRSYKIPEMLNPATASHRAPTTTSTREALQASLGGLEQEIMEAMEEGRQGFCGGWVSSMALDRMLDQRRDGRRFTPHKRKEILEAMGYIHHPGLHGGRVNVVITQEGGKPKLFVRKDSQEAGMTGAVEITRAYIEAQGWPS